MGCILIVDDSMLARIVVKEIIADCGEHDVYEASDGKKGLELFHKLKPDILFLDLTMPVMDGMAVLEHLNTMEHNTQIFVISAEIKDKTRQRVLSLGASDILKKPPPKADVMNILQPARDHFEMKLSDLEKDALKEFINIGFGQASAELSELLTIEAKLTVPSLKFLKPTDVHSYMGTEVKGDDDYTIIQQFFIGNFKGATYLLLPYKGGKSLLNLFGGYSDELIASYGLDTLEQETLMEIGNIVIGACISHIADVLGEPVTYSPPSFYKLKTEPSLPGDILKDKGLIITIKTLLQFLDHNVEGYLFILSDINTVDWLKESINRFLEPYK